MKKIVKIESKNMEFELSYESTFIPSRPIDGGYGGSTSADFSATITLRVYKDGKYLGQSNSGISTLIPCNPEHKKVMEAGATSYIYLEDTKINLWMKDIPVDFLDNDWAELADEADDENVKALKKAIADRKKAHEIEEAREVLSHEQATRNTFGGKLPTRQEVSKYLKRYNDIHNEGGEGWLPTLVTEAEVEAAKAVLAKG